MENLRVSAKQKRLGLMVLKVISLGQATITIKTKCMIILPYRALKTTTVDFSVKNGALSSER